MALNIKGLTIQDGRYYVIRRIAGKLKRLKLTRVEEGEAACNKQYAELSAAAVTGKPRTIADLLQHYIAEGMDNDELSEETKANYRYRAACAIETTNKKGEKIVTGLLPFFGKMLIDSLQVTHIAQYLQQGVECNRPRSANRDVAVLGSAYRYGLRKGWATRNPCRASAESGSAGRNSERQRNVKPVTHEQLTGTYERACRALQLLVNAAYLSGFRQVDLIKMERSQMTRQGLLIIESKTGHRRLMEWKPGVYDVFKQAVEFGDAIASKITVKLPVPRPLPTRIFVNMRGKPWTKWGIISAMKRADSTFSFRKLRRKAQTDSRGKNVLGHTGAMLKRYTDVEILEPLG